MQKIKSIIHNAENLAKHLLSFCAFTQQIMKKPIFKEEDRRGWLVPELEVAKMKFRRMFDKSWYGKLNYKILDILAKWLS